PSQHGVLYGNESEPDAILHRRPVAPARDPADGRAVLPNGVPVAGDGPVLQRERHEPPRHALALLAPEHRGADELALTPLDRPPQPDLERSRRRVPIAPGGEEA